MSVTFLAGVAFGAIVAALAFAVLIIRLAGWWKAR